MARQERYAAGGRMLGTGLFALALAVSSGAAEARLDRDAAGRAGTTPAPGGAGQVQTGPPAVAQEGRLVRAVMLATVEEDAAAVDVQLDYTVQAPAGTMGVPLAVVLFPNASVAVTEATSPVGNVTVELDGAGARWTGELRLQRPLAAAGDLPFQLRYRVFQRAGPRMEVPVIAVLWRPSQPQAGTFIGDVVAPPDLALYEPFPSGLTAQPELENGQRRYHVELPAVPALLAFSVPDGSPPWLTVGSALNGAAVVLALAFSAIGWRYLRRRTKP